MAQQHTLTIYTDWRGNVYISSTQAPGAYIQLGVEHSSVYFSDIKTRGKQKFKTIDYTTMGEAHFALIICRSSQGTVGYISLQQTIAPFSQVPDDIKKAARAMQRERVTVYVAGVTIRGVPTQNRVDVWEYFDFTHCFREA